MGTEVAKCVLKQNSLYALFQSTQQKMGTSCNGSYLAMVSSKRSFSPLHFTETMHKHWPYELCHFKKNSTYFYWWTLINCKQMRSHYRVVKPYVFLQGTP